MAPHLYATDNDVLAIDWHDVPENALHESDTFHEDILAVDGTKELRQAHLSAVAAVEDALLQWQFLQFFLHAAHGLLHHLAVAGGGNEFSFACESNVLSTVGIDHGTHGDNIHALVARWHARQIVLDVTAEVEFCPFFQSEVDVAFQFNAAGEPTASRHNHGASTLLGQLVDGFLDGCCAEFFLLGTRLGDAQCAGGKCRTLQLWHVERSLNGCYFFGHLLGRRCCGVHRQCCAHHHG